MIGYSFLNTRCCVRRSGARQIGSAGVCGSVSAVLHDNWTAVREPRARRDPPPTLVPPPSRSPEVSDRLTGSLQDRRLPLDEGGCRVYSAGAATGTIVGPLRVRPILRYLPQASTVGPSARAVRDARRHHADTWARRWRPRRRTAYTPVSVLAPLTQRNHLP